MPEREPETSKGGLKQRKLAVVCCALLLGLLYAGLRPFHSPTNDVTWVANRNAVRLGTYGTIISAGLVPLPASAGRSIEIWIQPSKAKQSGTLLAFYDPSTPRQLSLTHEDRDFAIRIWSSSAWRSAKSGWLSVDEALRDGKNAFWTVTFSPSGTAVYRNGALVRRSALAPLQQEISGRLVIGNSPIFDDSWSGVFGGLAIYDATLNGAQIARHYSTWMKDAAPVLTPEDACLALYLCNEHAGSILHNRARPSNDLYIPSKYVVLDKTILDPLWRAFSWRFGFWEDTFVNIAGFMPFGLFLCAYFSARGIRHGVLFASLIGFLVSIFIELTQVALPTRDSSMSDVLTNVLGSGLGAAAFRGALARAIDRLTG